MAILDDILKGPVDIAGLVKLNKTRETLLDGAFANLLSYAKKNWSYTASAQVGGEALLAGTANAAPCGGIATALKLVFVNGLQVPVKEIEYIRVTGYVWTGPTYLCFDPKVTGNLRKLDAPGAYGNGCIFNEHYYLKCGDKYYDPCLSVSYVTRDQSIKEKFGGFNMMTIGTNRRFLVTANQQTCILYMPAEPVPGFQGAWAMFDATKKNIEKALGSQTFRTEMAARNGTTTFAKFVNTLH